MGPIVRLVVKGIGMAREAAAARHEKSSVGADKGDKTDIPLEGDRHAGYGERESKLSPGYEPEIGQSLDPSHEAQNFLDDDEEDWYLDDAAGELDDSSSPPPYSSNINPDQLADPYDIPFNKEELSRLPYPVLIPQRRPRDRSRGFVRAYAPDLAACGVDQESFLKFVTDFYHSSKANPIFHVINLAAFVAGFTPSVAVAVVSTAVQIAAETSRQVQSRYRANTFLDKINEKYFQPRGLYCLIMTYKPNQISKGVTLDLSSAVAKVLKPANSPNSSMKDKLKSIRTSSGTTKGEIELPECAPLIYPALDMATTAENEKLSKLKEKKKLISGYLDRRAQAQYAHQNPGSKLAMPDYEENQQFASRYSDPNHPASNGSLISLLTGGHVNPKAGVDNLRQKYQDRKREKANAEIATAGGTEVLPQTRVMNREGLLARVLRQDVLYLMVMNMPSEEELAEARERLAAEAMKGSGEEDN